MTEEALMAAYCQGDQDAFLRLLQVLGPRLHGFFMRSFQDRVVADDLFQTTLLKLHRARATYQQDQPVRPWVFAIAARVRADELRSRKCPTEPLDDEAVAQAEAGPVTAAVDMQVEALDQGAIAERVRAAIRALPESQRLIVHLHRFEGLTFSEIARTLQITEGAAKLRAFRAYARLREQLAPLAHATATSGEPAHTGNRGASR